MSIDDEGTMKECECGLLAFEPVPCAVCYTEGNRSARYCTDCRRKCAECKEWVCEDHWESESEYCQSCNELHRAELEADVRAEMGSAFVPIEYTEKYRQDMKDAGRGHLLRD